MSVLTDSAIKSSTNEHMEEITSALECDISTLIEDGTEALISKGMSFNDFPKERMK